jgi:3-oxoacyl-[acyl-carrier protein] reductase
MKRVGLITGVSRERGIAAAVARRSGASHDLTLTGLPAYDAEHTEKPDPSVLLAELRRDGTHATYVEADLSRPSMPESVVAATVEEHGAIDTLVLAHAHSRPRPLEQMDAAAIDRHLTVNVRATMLLIGAFAAAHDAKRGQGRIVVFISGQRLGPMPSELAYAASKGAVEALVVSLAEELASAGIAINALNPGPTDTGLLTGRRYEEIRARFPAGRWGEPDDAARAVAWLTGEEGAWITGQVIHSEGGFRRWR